MFGQGAKIGQAVHPHLQPSATRHGHAAANSPSEGPGRFCADQRLVRPAFLAHHLERGEITDLSSVGDLSVDASDMCLFKNIGLRCHQTSASEIQ